MLQHQKQLFSLPNHVSYLNGAYMSPQLKSVEDTGIACLKRKNLPYEITSEDFFSLSKELKKNFAKLIDAPDYNHIAIIPSVSYGIANAAHNVALNKGDEILVVDEQFPSNIYVWKEVAEKQGAKVKVIQAPKGLAGRGLAWNQSILEAIGPKTAVVTMPHIHWADGTLFDLKSIRKKTKEVGALLIIDGIQSIGALPFSVAEIQPDALVCSGYKWLLGPYALGVAYYGDAFMNGKPMEHNWLNRKNSEDFSRLTHYKEEFQPKAGRYSMGESSNFVLAPMLNHSIKQLLEWQPNNIQEYCKHISSEAVHTLQQKGYFIEEEAQRAKHLFGVYLPEEMDIEALKKRLAAKNVYVSFRAKALRVSCNVYNTSADFDKLLSCF